MIARFHGEFAFRTHEPAYALSASERELVASAPFNHTPDGWRSFAWSIHNGVLQAYRAGEMDFRRMMEIVRNSSLGCSETDRVEVLAFTAEMALRKPAPNLRSMWRICLNSKG